MTTTDESSLTLNLDPKVRDRLKLAASHKGMPVERYCEQAIKSELARDEAKSEEQVYKPFDIEDLLAFRDELLGDRVFEGDSVDLIREAREQRTKQLEEWR